MLTYGIVAPAKTPRPIVEKLSKVLREVLATDEVKRRLAQEGAEPLSTTPEEHAAIIDREDTKWSAIIKSGSQPRTRNENADAERRDEALAAAARRSALAAMTAAAAQDFPTRPITLVVPYAAGGGNDAMARIAGEKMSKTLGQQVVIENRGPAPAARSRRGKSPRPRHDGYTLVIGGTGTLAIDPTLYGNVGYDPRKDFAPVGLIGASQLDHSGQSVPAGAFRQGVDRLWQGQPRQTELCLGRCWQRHSSFDRLFHASRAGFDATHVPYKGFGPALTDLVGGHRGRHGVGLR